jgi:hypothetical protein
VNLSDAAQAPCHLQSTADPQPAQSLGRLTELGDLERDGSVGEQRGRRDQRTQQLLLARKQLGRSRESAP